MQSAGPSPSAEQIRAKAAEVLARDDYDLAVRGREGSWLRELLGTILDWVLAPFEWVFRMTEGLPEALRWVVVLAAVALLLLLVWHIVANIVRAVRGDSGGSQSLAAARRREVDPEELEREADDAGRRGDYVTAVRRLFRAALLRLARSQDRPLRPGTTNRALLKRFGDRPDLVDPLRLLVETIDRKWYGDEDCSEADFDVCRNAHRRLRLGIEGGGRVQHS